MKWIATASAVVAVVLLVLIASENGNAANGSCDLGRFCLTHSASRDSAKSSQKIIFGIKLRNNLNNDARDLKVVYVLPRQMIVRSASTGAKRVGNDRLVWRFKRMVPGQEITLHVRAEVLAYAKKHITNTAQVFVNGERVPWLSVQLGYNINSTT